MQNGEDNINLMYIEVDQSIKVEYTSQDTILAFANGESYAIRIPAKVKKSCLTYLRQQKVGPPRRQIRIFTAGLFFLLKNHINHVTAVTIDREYMGHDHRIKDSLLNRFRRAGYQVSPHKIQFGHIGKQSSAHVVAIETYRKKRKPDYTVTEEEMLAEL